MNSTHSNPPSNPSPHKVWYTQAWHSILRLLDTGRDLFAQFIWRDLRAGMLDLSPLARPLRMLIVMGLTLVVLLLLLITQSAWVRQTFTLQPSLVIIPGRGLLVPVVLYPLGLFLLGLACTFALTGAAFSTRSIRIAIVILYWLMVGGWLSSLPISSPGYALLGAILVLLTTVIVLRPRRLRDRPLRLFALLLLTSGGLFATIHAPFVAQDRATGLSIGAANLESNLRALAIFAMPLLVLVGLDIADFTQHAAEWVTQAVTSLIPSGLSRLITLGALLWLLQASIVGWLDAPAVNQTSLSILGVAGLILLLIAAWLLLARVGRTAIPLTAGELMAAGGRLATPLIALYFLPPLMAYVLLEIALVVQNFAIELEGMTRLGLSLPGVTQFIQGAQVLYVGASALSDLSNTYINVWLRLLMVALLLLTPLAIRRKQIGVAFVMVSIAIHYLWVDLTRPGGVLSRMTWDDVNLMVILWAIIACGVLLLRAWQAGRVRRATSHLLLIIVVLALLRNTDFIEDPFSPFFAFAGLGFLAFGIGWDLLTAGRWANKSTARLPQSARIFMYIGYLIITATLVNWAVHSHDISQIDRFTGDAALFGFFVLGRPYLFLLIFGLATNIVRLDPIPADTTLTDTEKVTQLDPLPNVRPPAESQH